MAKGQKLGANKDQLKFISVAVIAGVNQSGKVIGPIFAEKSIKLPQLMKFLRKMDKFYKNEESTLYLDNLRVHYNKDFRAQADDFQIDIIYAPIHGSIYNPCERLWCYSKRIFKQRCFKEANFSDFKSMKKLIKECIL